VPRFRGTKRTEIYFIAPDLSMTLRAKLSPFFKN